MSVDQLKRGMESNFGLQVPRYFGRLYGLLNGEGTVSVDSVDPFAPDILGNNKPGNTTFTWFSQGLADKTLRADDTLLIQHEGPESPNGSGAVYYQTIPNEKHRVELSGRFFMVSGSSADKSRFGIAFMDDGDELLAVTKSTSAAFAAVQYIETVYRPNQPDSTTDQSVVEQGVTGCVSEYVTLIAEYDPTSGVLDAWLSLNLGAGSNHEIKIASVTQSFTGNLNRVGIYTSERVGYGQLLDVLHWKAESLA